MKKVFEQKDSIKVCCILAPMRRVVDYRKTECNHANREVQLYI